MKWRVNRAVKRSTLPPPSRLVMFVLSDRADARTAVIPEEHTPTQTELAEETGLGIATVKRHLDALTADGWIVRDVPSEQARARGERTRYRLALGGSATPPSTAQSDTSSTDQADTSSTAQSEPTSTDQADTSSQQAGITAIPELVSERSLSTAQSDTSSYLDDRNDQNDQLLGADAPSDETTATLFGSDTEGDAKAPEKKSAGKPKRQRRPEPQRDDVDALCNRLVELMLDRGCREPTITEAWKTEARLLLDHDRTGRNKEPITLDKALRLLEWSQNDPFWKGNILSIPKFRKQYDALREKALAEWERTQAGSNVIPLQRGYQPYQNPADHSVYFGAIS